MRNRIPQEEFKNALVTNHTRKTSILLYQPQTVVSASSIEQRPCGNTTSNPKTGLEQRNFVTNMPLTVNQNQLKNICFTNRLEELSYLRWLVPVLESLKVLSLDLESQTETSIDHQILIIIRLLEVKKSSPRSKAHQPRGSQRSFDII